MLIWLDVDVIWYFIFSKSIKKSSLLLKTSSNNETNSFEFFAFIILFEISSFKTPSGLLSIHSWKNNSIILKLSVHSILLFNKNGLSSGHSGINLIIKEKL